MIDTSVFSLINLIPGIAYGSNVYCILWEKQVMFTIVMPIEIWFVWSRLYPSQDV